MKFKFGMAMLAFSMSSYQAIASNNDLDTLKMFHKYGMTKCDKMILEHASLNKKSNWYTNIERPRTKIENGYSSVTLEEIFGQKGDTVKIDLSFLQTPTKCILTQRGTITFNGSCEKNIDLDKWYVNKKMPELDYTEYRNSGDVPMLAKEVNMGNFKICIQETRVLLEANHG